MIKTSAEKIAKDHQNTDGIRHKEKNKMLLEYVCLGGN